MASPFAEDLNNYGEGSYFIRDMVDMDNNKGRRTHYYKEGVKTIEDLASEAGNVTEQLFPGTDMPLSSVKITKLDGGRAVRVDKYSYRRAAPTEDETTQDFTIQPQYQKLSWYHLTIEELVGLQFPQGAPHGHIPSEPLAAKSTHPQDQLDTLTYMIQYPYSTDKFPLENSSVKKMIGKVNNNPYSPSPSWEDFPIRSLVFTAPTIEARRGPGGRLWEGMITFMYRPPRVIGSKEVSGWARMVERADGVFQLILEHEETRFDKL